MLDPASQARFEAARQRHFPAHRNLVPAHVTLFHHLPGEHEAAIGSLLAEICHCHAPSRFTVSGLRFLGRGTSYTLDMPAISALRHQLAVRWQSWLTAQDRQAWTPHVTVQNKVAAEAARRLHAELSTGFTPESGAVTGLVLWQYLGGPWHCLKRHAFAGIA